MKAKEKLDEALELLTQLRVILLKTRPSIELRLYEVELKICEAHDLLGGVGLSETNEVFSDSDLIDLVVYCKKFPDKIAPPRKVIKIKRRIEMWKTLRLWNKPKSQPGQ